MIEVHIISHWKALSFILFAVRIKHLLQTNHEMDITNCKKLVDRKTIFNHAMFVDILFCVFADAQGSDTLLIALSVTPSTRSLEGHCWYAWFDFNFNMDLPPWVS